MRVNFKIMSASDGREFFVYVPASSDLWSVENDGYIIPDDIASSLVYPDLAYAIPLSGSMPKGFIVKALDKPLGGTEKSGFVPAHVAYGSSFADFSLEFQPTTEGLLSLRDSVRTICLDRNPRYSPSEEHIKDFCYTQLMIAAIQDNIAKGGKLTDILKAMPLYQVGFLGISKIRPSLENLRKSEQISEGLRGYLDAMCEASLDNPPHPAEITPQDVEIIFSEFCNDATVDSYINLACIICLCPAFANKMQDWGKTPPALVEFYSILSSGKGNTAKQAKNLLASTFPGVDFGL